VESADTHPVALERLTLSEAASAIQTGRITSEQLVQACLGRISERDSAVGAWANLNPHDALALAREKDQQSVQGSLHGVPIGIKDVIDTAGMPTRFGSPIFDHHIPTLDATCVKKLRQAGAIIIGKTVTTEFATYHPGATANPLNLKHTPGGSSSGSAAGVADFQVPAALGTQTAGSVVRPASFCGVVGFKPSRDRYCTKGVLDTSPHLDTLGVFVRAVDDAILLDTVLSEHEGASTDNEVEIKSATLPIVGICQSPQWLEATPEMRDCLNAATTCLQAEGVQIKFIKLPALYDQLCGAQELIHAREAADCLGSIVDDNIAQVSEALITFVTLGRSFSETQYQQALELQKQCCGHFDDAINGCDVVLTPSAPGTAPSGLAATGSPVFCRIWTALGVPCISIPVAAGAGGLPLGLQLVGRFNQDKQLLRMARQIVPLISAWDVMQNSVDVGPGTGASR
jgi:Asp-tRNA(Asn)/Glu-tRNA(Gln) amidotransferase A subunit family amidase